MLNSTSRTRRSLLGLVVFTLVLLPSLTMAQTRTMGACSPIIQQSTVTGRVVVECGAGRADLQKIADRLNQLIDEARMTRSQVADIASLMNEFADARAGRSKLAAVMSVWIASELSNFAPNEKTAIYEANIDASDPAFGGSEKDQVIYYLNASEDEFGFHTACKIKDDNGLYGVKILVERRAGNTGRSTTVQLGPDDPVLQHVCRGMRLPLSTIMTGPDAVKRGAGLTIYDYLALDKQGVSLTLMSVQRDEMGEDFRPFWSAAFVARQVGATPRVGMGPDAFADAAQSAGLGAGAASNAPVNMDVSAPPLPFEGATNERPYPNSVVEEFGPDLQKMDAAWVGYLDNASIVLRGRSVPVRVNGKPQKLMPAFRVSDLSEPRFWSVIRDDRDILFQESCLAARFAVEKGYASPGDVPNYAQCGEVLYSR